jgi:hypothetical protein
MAINVVLQNDDLTVLGPPASIDLQVDIGPKGDPGSFIYSASGDPNVVTTPFTNNPASIGDLYFRTSNNTIYQYLAVPGGDQWEIISNIDPIAYNAIENITFSAGSGSVSILLNNIYENAPINLSTNDLAIQLTAIKTNPVVLSISNKTLTNGATRSLLLDFIGAEYSSGTWSSLSGSVSVNIGVNIA